MVSEMKKEQLASFFRRWAALVVDSAALLVLNVVTIVVLAWLFSKMNVQELLAFKPEYAFFALLSLAILFFGAIAVVNVGYFAVQEKKWGKTLGKRLLKIRVVGKDGKPITWKQAMLRNVLRHSESLWILLGVATITRVDPLIILISPAIAIFDVFGVCIGPWKQRVGDLATGTLVIKGG